MLQLYKGPVPDLSLIPLEPHWQAKEWSRYGEATLRLAVLQGRPRPGDLTPSEPEDEEEEEMPPVGIISVYTKLTYLFPYLRNIYLLTHLVAF